MEVSKAALRWDCTFRIWLVLSNSNFPSYFGNIFEVRGDAFRTTTFETGNVETVGDGVLLEAWSWRWREERLNSEGIHHASQGIRVGKYSPLATNWARQLHFSETSPLLDSEMEVGLVGFRPVLEVLANV